MQTSLNQQENSQNLKKLFTYLLESCSEEGFWKDSDTGWAPIMTTICCELFFNAGATLNDKWYVLSNGISKELSFKNCVQFLNDSINADGSFGSDLWDATRLGKLIVSKKLKTHFSNYSKLQKYIISSFESNNFSAGDTNWVGPGFYACGIDYFDLEGLNELSNSTLLKLLSLQQVEGHWMHTPQTKKSIHYSVWHTAQTIITLKRKSSETYGAAIQKASKWLIDNQEDSTGSWAGINEYEIYFTSYAVLALAHSEYQDAINDAVSFLHANIKDTGQCVDKGGTLMCALAYWELFNNNLKPQLSLMDCLLTTINSKSIKYLEDKVKNKSEGVVYVITIKKKHIEIVLGVIAVLAFVIVLYDHFKPSDEVKTIPQKVDSVKVIQPVVAPTKDSLTTDSSKVKTAIKGTLIHK